MNICNSINLNNQRWKQVKCPSTNEYGPYTMEYYPSIKRKEYWDMLRCGQTLEHPRRERSQTGHRGHDCPRGAARTGKPAGVPGPGNQALSEISRVGIPYGGKLGQTPGLGTENGCLVCTRFASGVTESSRTQLRWLLKPNKYTLLNCALTKISFSVCTFYPFLKLTASLCHFRKKSNLPFVCVPLEAFSLDL